MPEIQVQKKGKLDTSHRYDLLPLLRSSPGGIQRELVVYDFPECKGKHFFVNANLFRIKFYKSCYRSLAYRAECLRFISVHTAVHIWSVYAF